MAKKKKTYMERMTEKYGTANGASSASLSTASGSSTTGTKSSASNSGAQSYLERMQAKYGSTRQVQPVVNPQTQRKTVQSVIGNLNTADTRNTSNTLTKGTKVNASELEKFKGQSVQNLNTDRYVQNQVDSYKKPSVSDTLKNHNKASFNTKPLGSYISTALKSSGNPTGKDPDSLYRTDDMSEESRRQYREAALKDAKNPLNQAARGGQDTSGYNYMSDEEKKRYNEIYGVYGSKQAEEYKAILQDVINERIGQADYKNKYADSNILNKTAYQLTRGFGSGAEGLARAGEAFIGLTNSHASSPAEYTAAAMRNDEKNTKLENAVYDIANSTGYMMPGMIASAAAAPATGAAAAGSIGNALFALAQYGNTYREDINSGRSAGKSQVHALQQGIDELATNWLLGGIGAFGGGTLTKVFKDTAVGKAFKSGVSKLTSNPTARRLLTSFAEYLTDAGSEAAQEYTQYYTNAITENLLFDAGNDLSLTNSEAWYSALLGGLNAMVLNAPNYAQRTAADVHTIREGLKPELGTSEGLTALAENIANNDAASQNDALHAVSNETFDKVMEMNNRIENGQKVSAIEKGEAAIAARNIEAVSKMENTMREAVEGRKKAAEEQRQAAVRETDNNKIADNKDGFKEYTAENAAGLYSEDSRNNMVSLYDGTVDAGRYRQAYQRAYAAGFNNIDEKTAYDSMNMLYLTNEQKLQAYKDGMRDSNLYANKKLEYEQGEAREGGFTEGIEKVDEGTGKFLDWAGKKTGVKIQIAEGLKGAAEINLDKGVMKINPYSENFVGSASHELTHLIKLYDRKSFDKLQKITVESLMKSNNMSYEELYAKYEKSYREQASADYTVEDILEEITADGATAYLNDADFAERVVKEDSGLGKKIADFFKEIADTLKAIINEKGIRAVGRVMRENEARYRTAANIWYQALENAGTKYKEGYTVKETESGIQYMLNIPESKITDEYIENNYRAVRNMDPVATLTGKEFDNGKDNSIKAVTAYFDELNNLSSNEDAGAIELSKRFVKDVLGHKPNRRKFIMMAAVPQIIRDGKILDYRPNYDSNGNGRVTIAAPIKVEGNNAFEGNYYGIVTAKVYPDHNRAYILNYTYTSKEKAASVFRQTGMQESISQEPGTEVPSTIQSIIKRLLKSNDVMDKKIESSSEFKTPSVKETSSRGSEGSLSDESILGRLQKINIQSAQKEKVQLSRTDSSGHALTNEQAEYFADSKIVDADGNLKVMYHQTANDFTVFDPKHAGAGGSDYETPSGIFLKPNANDIGVKGSKQMALYANVTNPLELADRAAASAYWSKHIEGYAERLSKLKKIDTEYQEKYEAAEETNDSRYSEIWNKRRNNEITEEEYNRLIDEEGAKLQAVIDEWKNATDKAAAELKDMVNDYLSKSDYDGVHLVKDSGSFGRTVETWIALKPEQVKSVANKKPTANEDIRFQLNEPIEYTRDLIAVRNVSSDNLASMLELEGMPSPSIAITKDSLGHTQFGDVTFIFGKDTIDPEADSRNMVFTADAWTPTFDQLGVDTEIVEDKLENMRSKLSAYSRENIMFRDTLPDAENFSYKLEKYNGNLHDMADNSYDWKLLYLNDKGDSVKIKTETIVEPYSKLVSNEELEQLAKSELREMAAEYKEKGKMEQSAFVRENRDRIEKIFEDTLNKSLYEGTDLFKVTNFIKNIKASQILDGLNQYLTGKQKSYSNIDYAGAKKEIDSKIDIADYHKWVDKNLKGVIGKKGIRNEKDMFTPSGNRRSFRQLHDAYTAANIVKALWRNAEQGVSSFGSASHSARTVRGATAEKMNSIDDIHAKSGLLQSDISSNAGEAIDAADEKLSNIYNAVSERAGSWSIGWDESYNEATIKAATKAKTAKEVRKYFADNSIRINESEAKQLFDVFDELRNLPTDYFEAKAKRVVAWDEVKLAVVPDDIDPAIIELMRENGISRIEEYPAGDDAARLEIENKAEDLKFQLNIDDDPEWNYYANMVQDSNQQAKDAADTLGQLLSSVDYMPSDKAIERTAKRIKKYTETDTSLEEIQGNIKTIFNYIANNERIDGREISAVLADYAGQLISNSHKVEVDPAAEKLFREFRDTIKGQTFHLPKNFEGELESLGGIRHIRNQSGLAINITKDKGVTIDILYDELSDKYPGMFNKDITNPADQLEHIIETYNQLKPKPKVSYANEEDYDAFRYYAGQEVFKAYIAEGAAEAGRKTEYRALQNTYKKKLKENAKSEKEMAALQAKAAELEAKYQSELNESKKKIYKTTAHEREYQARKSMKTRYWKDQIMKDAKELSTWMLKPTDKKHVPEALRQPLANFLSQLDFTSRDLAADGEPTQRSLYWMQLKDTWMKIAQNGGIAEGDHSVQYMVVDTDTLAKMSELTDKIKGIKKLEELEYVDVLKLADIMKAMKHSIENANQMISLNRSVNSVATGTLNHLKKLYKEKNKSGSKLTKLIWDGFNFAGGDMRMLDATTKFHTFGSDAEAIYNAVRKGFNKKVKHTAESAEWFSQIKKEVGVSDKEVNNWAKEMHEFKASDGTEAVISTTQLMNLYNLMMRPQARDHILQGGISLTPVKLREKISDKLTSRWTDSTNIHVNQGDVRKLLDMLTEEQKLFASKLAKTMLKMADWGNETSMELMGYKKFNDQNYWPIKSSREYLTTSMDQAAAGGVVGVAVKNAGPTQSTVKHANNPITIGDAIDVWSEHVNFMANYNAFSIPLTDMVKWYNYVDYGDIVQGDAYKFKSSIKQELNKTFGRGTSSFVLRFVEDINGMSGRVDGSLVKGMISAFKGSAVGANLSVAIQQPTAFFRALAEIDAKYLTAGLAHKPTADWETIKKYSAMAQWKDWGFFEIDTGKSMKQITTGSDTLLQELNEKQMWLAGKGDEITWKRLWSAAEQEVKAEHKELQVKSDAFYRKTAEVFDRIIDRTQVVDSVFTKSDLMRSKNELNKALTSFFAEPTKSYNMLYRAFFDSFTAEGAAKAAARKKVIASLFGFILSNAAAAMAKSIITAMRDKGEDRDKEFWDRWYEHAAEEFAGNINPINYIPYIKDIVSVMEGYTNTQQSMQAVQDLYYVAQRWTKTLNGEASYTILNNIGYSTKLLSDVSGLAIYSAKRDINAILDTVIEFSGSDSISYEKDKLFYKDIASSSNTSYYLSRAMRAYADGNKRLGDKIIGDMVDAGISEDNIATKKGNMLKDDDRLDELIAAKTAGDEEMVGKLTDQLIAAGYDEDIIEKKLNTGISSYMNENGYSYSGLTEALNNVTDYSSAGFKEFNETYAKWAELVKHKNGWDDEKCRSQLRSQVTKYFKPLYKEGNAQERSRILNILSRAKAGNKKLYEKESDIKKWADEK